MSGHELHEKPSALPSQTGYPLFQRRRPRLILHEHSSHSHFRGRGRRRQAQAEKPPRPLSGELLTLPRVTAQAQACSA